MFSLRWNSKRFASIFKLQSLVISTGQSRQRELVAAGGLVAQRHRAPAARGGRDAAPRAAVQLIAAWAQGNFTMNSCINRLPSFVTVATWSQTALGGWVLTRAYVAVAQLGGLVLAARAVGAAVAHVRGEHAARAAPERAARAHSRA